MNTIGNEFGADFYFHKGHTLGHVACQDYVQVGCLPDDTEVQPYGILTDGCSSSPDTDIGARILAKVAHKILSNSASNIKLYDKDSTVMAKSYYYLLMCEAWKVAQAMGLPMESLDATVLTMLIHSGRIRASIYGDGFVAVKYKDGTIRGIQCCYPGGYPRYLSYALDDMRAKNRDELGGGGYAEPFLIPVTSSPILLGRTDIDKSIEHEVPITDDIEAVFLMSDGILQFVEDSATGRKAVPFEEPMRSLLAIKEYAGQFVQRRASKFLMKECTTKKWTPLDDVSIVGIKIKGN